MPVTIEEQERSCNNRAPKSCGFANGSVVSYRARGPWGDNKYRGNCSGYLIKDLVEHYQPRSVADPMCGGNTTGDVCEWLNDRGAGIEYWCSDLHKGHDATTQPIPGTFELVFVHPPYHDMIPYNEGESRCLANCMTYAQFVKRLEFALSLSFDAVAPGGRLAVLVGDLRKKGAYTSMVRDVLNLEDKLGQLRSVIIKQQHNVVSNARRYSNLEDARILHEYLVIFKRPLLC